MFGLGAPELMIILAIFILVFGGRRLPEIGAGLGRGIASFKNGLRGSDAETQIRPREKGETNP